jgi:hypothetical protein
LGFLNRLLGREGQAGSAPLEQTLSVCTVHAGSLVATVGESYRQEALRAVADVVTDAGPFLDDLCDYALELAQTEPERRWFRAVLVPEPDDTQDPNAIAVYAEGGGHVAYLSREHARAYSQVFASLTKRGYSGAACPAMLTGGGGKSYGVVLALSSPGHVMGDLHAEEHAAGRAERARAKDERGRAIYEAALAGDPWEAIAAAHDYETASGAYAAARAFAKLHGLELPRRTRGRRPEHSDP